MGEAGARSMGAGVPFGVLFALVGDEIMTQVMGLTAPPKAWPIDAHVRGLVGHLAYAAAAESAFRALEAAAALAERAPHHRRPAAVRACLQLLH